VEVQPLGPRFEDPNIVSGGQFEGHLPSLGLGICFGGFLKNYGTQLY